MINPVELTDETFHAKKCLSYRVKKDKEQIRHTISVDTHVIAVIDGSGTVYVVPDEVKE